MSSVRRILVLCSVVLALAAGVTTARAGGGDVPRTCDDFCRALLGLPEPQPENGPTAYDVRLSRKPARKIDYFFYLDQDCTQPAPVRIEVVQRPRAGLLAANAGRDRAFYPPANPRSACNNQIVDSSRLYYLRNGGARGGDDFTVVAIYPDSSWEEIRYRVSWR